MVIIFCSLQNNAKATRTPAKQMVKACLEQPCAELVGYAACT